MTLIEEYAEARRIYAEWVDGLKPGDEIALLEGGRFGRGSVGIVKVSRISATQVIVDFGNCQRRFMRGKYRGQEIGPGRCGHIKPVTQEVRDAAERASLVDWLNALNNQVNKLTLDDLRTIKAALDEQGSNHD